MKVPLQYPIGTAGVPWGSAEKSAWASSRTVRRSYADDVVSTLRPLPPSLSELFDVVQYGEVGGGGQVSSSDLPLLVVRPRLWDSMKPAALVTGGVHGYETSGVAGAMRFLSERASSYANAFNVVVAPCVSPWGYERVERWNADALDPNRSFGREEGQGDGPTEEGRALLKFLDGMDGARWLCHVDLHETTDTDVTEFRRSKAARDGLGEYENSIPDGFYLVGDSDVPRPDFLKAIIDKVREVTHIAKPDANGKICGEDAVQAGAFVIPGKKFGICASATGAPYSTTTEVYPDSPKTNDEECAQAQVVAVCAALDYVIDKECLRSG